MEVSTYLSPYVIYSSVTGAQRAALTNLNDEQRGLREQQRAGALNRARQLRHAADQVRKQREQLAAEQDAERRRQLETELQVAQADRDRILLQQIADARAARAKAEQARAANEINLKRQQRAILTAAQQQELAVQNAELGRQAALQRADMAENQIEIERNRRLQTQSQSEQALGL